MSTLYEIIKSLQSASGNLAKIAVLEAHKDNELLKAYLKAVMDPSLSYYIKRAPVVSTGDMATLDAEFIDWIVENLAGRKVTGNSASSMLKQAMACMDAEGQELTTLLISRSVGAGVGDTMILKTFPGLYFQPGYMRCSLMTPKIKKHFESLTEIICQKKADGSFCYVKKPQEGAATAFTRAGTAYPQWLVERLAKGAPSGSYVYVGELLVYRDGRLLDRQTGNGIYNSILKGADEQEFDWYDFSMEAWDLLPISDFEAGLCEIEYRTRFETLERHSISTESIQVIDTDFVKSLDEAYKIYSGYTADGFEGAVIKDGAAPWRDHTSPYNVKLKIAFEIDLEVVGVEEGTGKAANMMGALKLQSRDGLLKTDVGTGFRDTDRIDWWLNSYERIGSIVTVKANDIIGSRNSDSKSLFLPVFEMERPDKSIADSYEECVAQFEAAKNGGK